METANSLAEGDRMRPPASSSCRTSLPLQCKSRVKMPRDGYAAEAEYWSGQFRLSADQPEFALKDGAAIKRSPAAPCS